MQTNDFGCTLVLLACIFALAWGSVYAIGKEVDSLDRAEPGQRERMMVVEK
jgi:hypothetical protein